MAKEKRPALKTTELTFKIGVIRKLVAHAKSCAEYLPLQLDEQTAGGPGLVLVGEMSVYLASNGKDDTPLDQGNRIAYAIGMNPADWEDEFELIAKKVEMVGSSDDVVFLRLSDVETVLSTSEDWEILRICVVHDGSRMHKALMIPAGRTTGTLSRTW